MKAASDMHVPVGGAVIAANTELESTPELVNQDCYGKGWFIRIKPSDVSELDKLMNAAAYEQYCSERD